MPSHANDCVAAGRRPSSRSTATCEGPLQRHHCIPKREIRSRLKTLRREGQVFDEAELMADWRNIVAVCHRHHGWIEGKRIYLARAELPEGIEDFAAELGLDWYLDRFFPVEQAA